MGFLGCRETQEAPSQLVFLDDWDSPLFSEFMGEFGSFGLRNGLWVVGVVFDVLGFGGFVGGFGQEGER